MEGELFRFRDTATPVASVHLHAYPMHNAILILLANREPVPATRYEAAVSQKRVYRAISTQMDSVLPGVTPIPSVIQTPLVNRVSAPAIR